MKHIFAFFSKFYRKYCLRDNFWRSKFLKRYFRKHSTKLIIGHGSDVPWGWTLIFFKVVSVFAFDHVLPFCLRPGASAQSGASLFRTVLPYTTEHITPVPGLVFHDRHLPSWNSVDAKNVGVANISLRALWKRIVRYWHRLGCRAIDWPCNTKPGVCDIDRPIR